MHVKFEFPCQSWLIAVAIAEEVVGRSWGDRGEVVGRSWGDRGEIVGRSCGGGAAFVEGVQRGVNAGLYGKGCSCGGAVQ